MGRVIEMVEQLRAIYDRFDVDGAEPRPASFAEAFKGWFSGKGRGMSEVDEAFAAEAGECVKAISESGEPGEALEAIKIIFSRPQTKKYSQRDLMFAAMHRLAAELVPKLNDAELQEALGAMDGVPKPYRFPVYKAAREQIKARLGEFSGN